MLDEIDQSQMQRSYGLADLGFTKRNGRVALDVLRQEGAAKVMLPRVAGDVPEAVFLNTSGGLTGGDHLRLSMDVGAGCRVLATTQTAERGYAVSSGAARLDIRARVGAGGRLDWMPQETILFQNANLHRTTEIDLAAGAECLLAESLVLGRAAMGETLHHAGLQDHRIIRRKGRPLWAEGLRLNADVLADRSAALLRGDRAFAVVCLIAQGAEDAVGPLRAALGAGAAVSGWDGRCVLRISAADGWPMRQQLARVLKILTGRALPRVWQSGGLI
ncbi:urease accessory protein UreD (plasmid) [Pseudorhodobacter turbinis]|uniref:Urease accessory protein UreD n=1 Tax=Pseudorhodobacter turbinis TaxID=2500533 RepID=A0A4V1E1D0_9RHOB|nr:urease accessory protein UreD [Pseudorhodobacter turbinis]QCO57704.1 urease accessory protein UreD [Pseudorhodobacter turbinis]